MSSARSAQAPRRRRCFLAEVARPSQIGVNPFLRGFFFAGMRAHIVEDVLEVGPRSRRSRASRRRRHAHLLTRRAVPAAGAPSRAVRTRKVAQWVFLPHLFSKILLADKSALETSRASTRTSVLKRTLLATASLLILIVLGLATISFFNNHALEERVAKAAAAPVSPVATGGFAAQAISIPRQAARDSR